MVKFSLPGGVTNSTNYDVLATAELYDPATGTFRHTNGNMNARRAFHSATLLPNGKVLIAGGSDEGHPWSASDTAELYNPDTEQFSLVESKMTALRSDHSATLLPNGKVLIVGNGYPNTFNQNGHGVIPVAILGSSELNPRDINIQNLRLQGLTVKVAGKSSNYLAHFEDINQDGYEDLVVQFQDSDSWIIPGDDYATLAGNLNNGIEIMGKDSIRTVP
jgi:hypothetical protein